MLHSIHTVFLYWVCLNLPVLGNIIIFAILLLGWLLFAQQWVTQLNKEIQETSTGL